MKAKAGTEKCPHCGGKNGFHTRIIFDCARISRWDGESIDTEGYKVVSETNPRCLDCGRSVRSAVTYNAK